MASTLRFQDYQFQVQLNSGTWRWTTRVDVSQATTEAFVRDVITPYGLLRDSIPIPGDVIAEMAASILQVQNSYTPSILLGNSSLTFNVDEGRGVTLSQTVEVTNNGIFGSLLSVNATSSAAYVTSTPAILGGLLVNESGQLGIAVDSSNLLSTSSPYSQTITLASDDATNSPQAVTININVRPKSTILLSSDLVFDTSLSLNGSYPALPAQQFTISNTGASGSQLDFQIRSLTGVSWLAGFSPTNYLSPGSSPIAGGASKLITVQVAPSLNMGIGTYQETLVVTGYSTNMSATLNITLNIT